MLYIKSKVGNIDIIVPNLGNGKSSTSNYLEKDEWIKFLNINLLSVVNLIDTLFPIIKKNESSSIVFISSIVAVERIDAPYGYSSSKISLIPLMKHLSYQYAEHKIRVNCVLPGNVYFEGGRWEELLSDNINIYKEYILTQVPLKRLATPEEIANSIVFLSSPKSSFTTGSTLVIDGGQTRSW